MVHIFVWFVILKFFYNKVLLPLFIGVCSPFGGTTGLLLGLI